MFHNIKTLAATSRLLFLFVATLKQIQLTGKHSDGKFAIVDDEDYERLMAYVWRVQKVKNKYYAITKLAETGRAILMHRLIMGVTDRRIFIDHKNRDGLSNWKLNLRESSHAQNMKNSTSRIGSTSEHLGVYWRKDRNKWAALIRTDGIRIHLGLFEFELDAAKAYNEVAAKYHKDYANLNIVA